MARSCPLDLSDGNAMSRVFSILIIGSYHATKARNRLQRPHLVKLTLSRKERGMKFGRLKVKWRKAEDLR
jgi:hypothetical protein